MFNPKTIIEKYQISDVQVAKIKALVKAYRELGIQSSIGKPEAYFSLKINDRLIEGYADLDCGDHGEEYKLTSHVDMYLDLCRFICDFPANRMQARSAATAG